MSRVIDFLIVVLIFSIVVAAFVLTNNQEVIFNIPILGQFAMSLGYLVGGFSLFGFLLGMFYSLPALWRGRKTKSESNKKIHDLEKQLEGMKMSLETLSNTMLKTPVADGSATAEIIDNIIDSNN